MSARFTAMLFCVGLASVADAKPFTELFPHTKFQQPEAQEFVESLDYQQGTIKLDTGGIHLKVPSGFYFLGVDDARRVITEAWRNPPSTASGVLGVIFPAAQTPLDDTWGAVITFQEDGYVSDEDAANIDYTELLMTMQDSTAGANDERTKQRFPAIKLIGWASPPFYDKTSHKLHWAKELAFGDSLEHTLNYDVRALGRRGVLKINFVASMDQLANIKNVIPAVMAMPEFEHGLRYEDYVPSADKVAAYGIGGLIAGKVLSKAGFLAIALAFLKKGWMLIPIAVAGLFGAVRRLFVRKSVMSP